MSDGTPDDSLAPGPPPAPGMPPATPPSVSAPDGSDRHRRRRRRSHREPSDEGGAFRISRRIIGIGGLLAIVLAAVVAVLLLSQQPGPVAVASPTAALPTLPGGSPWISTPRPTVAPTQPPTPAPSASPASPSAAASASAAPASLPPGGVVARRIRVPSVGIDLPVVEGDGVDAPLGKAAHYPGTAWPGQDRNIYLYAHARDGMFIALWDAKVGDAVDLTLADGTTRAYRITKVLPRVAWNAMEYLDPGDTEILTLQTCTSYEQTAPRYIVIAEPVG